MIAASATPVHADRLRRILAIAAPILVVVLTLLSLCTLWFAGFIHSAPLLEPGGVITWQAKVELILAYVNLGWVGLLILGYWRGWLPLVLLGLAGFVVNYIAWAVMALEIPA